jgi:hypothetical protein
MKSTLFSDGKAATSFGRLTGSRRALKRKAAPSDHCESFLQEGGGTTNYKTSNEGFMESNSTTATTISSRTSEQRSNTVTTSATGLLLSKTLDLMKEEFKEKERQKKSMLKVRVVRDKIAGLTRQYDHLSKRYVGMMNRGMDEKNPVVFQLLETQLNDIMGQLGQLDAQLCLIQDTEIDRRDAVEEVLFSTDPPFQDKSMSSSSEESASVSAVPPHAGMVLVTRTTATSPLTTVQTPTESERQHGSVFCIECSVMPSSHQCRRCKQYVCTSCCSTKRGLEMTWWCSTCFEQESLTTQKQIRDGNYHSDGSASDTGDHCVQ